ncbi:MAG: hypothetical protein L0Z07_01445 [Planctomycetes bacterium]|nr:hypothetical protein [Planctomycetota bacterium]
MSDGLPPFALADPSGTIQRYVEPVPNIDLEPYVGSVVTVRHDTGQTLLASQLELPPLPANPIASRGIPGSGGEIGGVDSQLRELVAGIHQAEFVDNDDSTVELLPEGAEEVQNGQSKSSSSNGKSQPGAPLMLPEDAAQDVANEPIGGLPMWTEEPPPGAESVFDGGFPQDMPGEETYNDCPECYPECDESCPTCGETRSPDRSRASHWLGRHGKRSQSCRIFADVEFNLMRLHAAELAAGKLSEKYELAPRFVLGFEGGDISDGRVRYWTYGRETPIFEGGGVRVDFDVLDIEATQRFQIRRSDIIVGAGFRMAAIEITDDDNDAIGTDLLGMTVAADARTYLCSFQDGDFSFVYGARLSILGGDWGGDATNDFVDVPIRDDNVVADELRAGVEYSCCYRRFDLRAQVAFEMQNWHSDVLSQDGGTDSIGFIGPGIHLGAQF